MDAGADDDGIFDDVEIFDVLRREVERQNTTIQLIASENFTSPAVMAAQGSVLTNKYSEGYPGKRYYGGNYVVDEAEELARERVTALFGADHANVQPHSGANANMAVYLALLEPGDTVMGMRLDQGGHLTHGSPVNFSGRLYEFVSYGVSESDERLDYDQIRDLAREERPKAIIAGATAYPRVIDFAAVPVDLRRGRRPADLRRRPHRRADRRRRPPRPVPLADVVTFTTHKTLRGPRGGGILCTEEYAKAIDKAVFPGLQGGPLMHVIAAKAVGFREAAQPVLQGLRGPDRRQRQGAGRGAGGRGVPARLRRHRQPPHARRPAALRPELTGKVAQEALDGAGITLNKNTIPNDPRSPFVTSGLRIGTAAVTTAGMGEPEMAEIASLIARVLRGRSDTGALVEVREAAAALCSKYMPYPTDAPDP